MTTQIELEKLVRQGGGASADADRAVVNGAASVSALRASVPSALDFDLAFEAAAEPHEELSLDWIVLGVDRKGEAYVMDADSGFYRVDLLPEFWACDNGIEYPKGLAAGLYLMSPVHIRTDFDGDPTFNGTIEPLCIAAQAIEARRAETAQTGSVGDESAVRQDAPNDPRKETSNGR